VGRGTSPPHTLPPLAPQLGSRLRRSTLPPTTPGTAYATIVITHSNYNQDFLLETRVRSFIEASSHRPI